MTALLRLLAFGALVGAGSAAVAQDPFEDFTAPATCHAVTGPPDITEDGRFAVPEPTPEECDAVAALVEKFLGTDPRDFSRSVEIASIAGNVRVHIGRMSPYRPRPIGSVEDDRFGTQHVVTWQTRTLTVVVYQTQEFTGPATAVLISDKENPWLCNFPRWPVDGDPRQLSIEDIQQALRSGLAAETEHAACHLEMLPID